MVLPQAFSSIIGSGLIGQQTSAQLGSQAEILEAPATACLQVQNGRQITELDAFVVRDK